jgi:hypothetical protein
MEAMAAERSQPLLTSPRPDARTACRVRRHCPTNPARDGGVSVAAVDGRRLVRGKARPVAADPN